MLEVRFPDPDDAEDMGRDPTQEDVDGDAFICSFCYGIFWRPAILVFDPNDEAMYSDVQICQRCFPAHFVLTDSYK